MFNPDAPPRKKRALRTSDPEVHYFNTEDNVRLRLTRYQGGKKGPVILAHGLGVSSLAFSTDLIETNMTEYLFAHGYDVWLLDYRSSIELPYAATPYTADDVAAYDWPAAVKTVLSLTGASTVQAVVHCYGAITFNMAMCLGLQGVRSAVCSQVGAHLSVIPLNRIKAGIYLDKFIGDLGVKSLTMYTDTHDNWLEQLYNAALNVYPYAVRGILQEPGVPSHHVPVRAAVRARSTQHSHARQPARTVRRGVGQQLRAHRRDVARGAHRQSHRARKSICRTSIG